MNNNEFLLLGNLNIRETLEKSTKKSQDDERIIVGEISSSARDEEGDSMIQKSLDYSYLDDRGVLKYEHLPKNSPSNIIGFPHERFTDDSRTIIKGALFEGHAMADDAWSLIKAIERHNKKYPRHQKTLGFSVEGFYAQGARKGGMQKGAKITNIVITPNPILKSTWLGLVQENHRGLSNMMKSLNATPTSTNIPDKTGIDAITKEQIDRRLKRISEDAETLSSYGYEVKVERLGRMVDLSKLPIEKALNLVSLFPGNIGFSELSDVLDKSIGEGILSGDMAARLESAWRARNFKLVGDIITESLKEENNVF